MNMRLNHFAAAALVSLMLAACGGDSNDTPSSQAQTAGVAVVQQAAGVTPLIASVSLQFSDFADLVRVTYTIAPKPGTFSKPVRVTYERSWLERNNAWNGSSRQLGLTVFGLYANYTNNVTVTATFRDGSVHTEQLTIAAPAYNGPAAVYNTPDVKTARSADGDPGFDFMMIQNRISAPVVLDSDGNLRWVGESGRVNESFSSVFDGEAFVVGSFGSPELHRISLDGKTNTVPLASPRYTNFHHELSLGKTGLLSELDANVEGVSILESNLAEVGLSGQILKEWDLAAIFRETMRAGGDDPSNFVRDGVDWLHTNSAIYVPADDTLLISSRENFVFKLDYSTGKIKWIFGDTTKHWYIDYPSLRALALKLEAGKAPVGQHSLSFDRNGNLLLFNNGYHSINNPPGAAAGENRDFSTVSRYVINETARTATEVWSYAPTPSILSDICSSVYEPAPGRHLVAYSVAAARTRTKLVSLDSVNKVVFDYEFPTRDCNTAFNVKPIAFDNLILK